MNTSILIPTYNASQHLERLLIALRSQNLKDTEILVIDSSSHDKTVEIAKVFDVRIFTIPKKQFNHGGTRTMVGKLATGDILVYLTQDALPVDEKAVRTLIQALCEDNAIGLTFGRQVPHEDAVPLARHLRFFNYPDRSYTRTLGDKARYGVKTAFCSNSFAAYRRSALEDVGWFQDNLLMGEDIHVCARMLMKGYAVRYVAEAVVYHSHNYTVAQEFKRYFDLGVFFEKEGWLLDEFGRPEGEGIKFVQSEFSYLASHGFLHLLPVSMIRAATKLISYRLGHYYRHLPK
ncbi:MAG: glycosyltransferase family 2 protein, partial [Nitrospiraceae bacterium]